MRKGGIVHTEPAMATLTKEQLARLPEPVQRSLHRAGVVGNDIPTSVRIRQKGRIRSKPGGPWMNFAAREEYSLADPGFEWKATMKVAGVPVGRATDSLRDGRGAMHVRVLGLFVVVDATGPEMDQGSLMRWLNETMWFPAVWATDVVSWEPLDRQSAIGSVTAGDREVKAEFRFDQDGRLVDFVADRFQDTGHGFQMAAWSTPLTAYHRFGGYELPSAGSAVWHLEDGPFEYIQLRLTDAAYSY